MRVADLAGLPQTTHEAAARLLVSEFEAPSGWPDFRSARAEVDHVLQAGFTRAALIGNELVGWIGALPEYHGRAGSSILLWSGASIAVAALDDPW